MTAKIDFKKSLDAYRAQRNSFRHLQVPDLRYIMMDGDGDPNTSPDFAQALEAMYPVAYAVKFASKQHLGRDYVVPPLEGLWWAPDMASFTELRDKSQWQWTLMIMVPDWIEESLVDRAVEAVRAKKSPAKLDDIRLEFLSEGTCIQTLHLGSFDDESEVLSQLHNDYIPAQGLTMVGKHHEIYLSDSRKVAPEKMRTILRQPVRNATDAT